MDDHVLGIHAPTVMCDVEELRGNGYQPEALGMTLVASHDEGFDIPVIDVVADMKSRYDIDLYEPDPANPNDPVRIIGGVFPDPHPDEWWERAHRDRTLIVVAGDTPRLAAAYENAPDAPFDLVALLMQGFIGQVRGLVIRGYESGIGTKMPGS